MKKILLPDHQADHPKPVERAPSQDSSFPEWLFDATKKEQNFLSFVLIEYLSSVHTDQLVSFFTGNL